MRAVVLVFMLLLETSLLAQQSSLTAQTPKPVWKYSKQCNGRNRLGVTVRLGRKLLYRGVLPICRTNRASQDGHREFYFSGGHVFQNEYRTRSSDSIEGDLWDAAGEADTLILGVSFATKKQVLLNTLHIARLDKQTRSELDEGIVMTTYPFPVR